MKLGCLLVAVFFAHLLCAGCHVPEIPKKAHVLRFGIPREPQSLDPRRGAEVVSVALQYLLFEGLTRFNPDNTISLALAESVDISMDKTRYTFYLRPTLWSDGTLLTAHDFAETWKQCMAPNFPAMYAHLLFFIKNAEKIKRGHCALEEAGVYALNDLTLVVDLEKPTPFFLDLTSFPAFFPIQQKIDREYPAWYTEPGSAFVCNGPFCLKAWTHTDSLYLEKNPYYFNKDRILTDVMFAKIIIQETTAWHLYQKGEIDFLHSTVTPLPAEFLIPLREHGQVSTYPASGSLVAMINIDQFPFNNVSIRRAFSMALDRCALVDNITQLGEEPAWGAVPPLLKENRVDVLLHDRQPAQACALFETGLQELGIDRGSFPTVVYLYPIGEISKQIASTLQQRWKDVLGIDVALEALDHPTLVSRMKEKNFQFAQTIWLAQYNDQTSILERFRTRLNGKNYPGWENADFARLLERSFYEAGEIRRQTLLAAEALLLEEMPVIPLLHMTSSLVKKPYVKNLVSPFSSDVCYAYVDDREVVAAEP